MKKLWIIGAIVASTVLTATAASAAELGLGLSAGTQGLGVEFGVGITKWFALRGGGYWLDLSDNVNYDGIDYDGTLELGGYGLKADFFPMKGRFRLTAGVFSNRNGVVLGATPSTPVEIGGTTYQPSEVGRLSGDLEFDSVVPYLGIGWGNIASGKRVGFLCDIGVLRQGAGSVALSSSTGLVSPSDLEAEAATIEDEIKDYEYWPIISFGLAIRF